ncbi:hypothetical protein JJQ59_36510 (plasmid) [Cupriavidus necator]|uniref:Uncharacterized protein n=1 Tax=Cupriavidus necator TaxID=106590 RepID=A0A367PDL2_CUPNE|nr:hypothetical protein [Cupriavidus necator]QQX89086.1 hypothetical protein JJQ59_36510 [Cupriavidus necator]RCJ05654.1 hypothetical protein DDK22_25745 [Cupriavidus necator]
MIIRAILTAFCVTAAIFASAGSAVREQSAEFEAFQDRAPDLSTTCLGFYRGRGSAIECR